MAPVLLDHRGLLKVGISILLALVVVFGGGFIIGYQKAVMQQLALTQNRGIELPSVDVEQADALATVLAPQSPAIKEVGALIDVDEPDPVSAVTTASPELVDVSLILGSATQAANSHPTVKLLRGEKAQSNSSHKELAAKSVPVKKMMSSRASSNIASLPIKTVLTETGKTNNHSSDLLKTSAASSEVIEVSKLAARYSIQVGMYGQRVNAGNLVAMLEAQGLNAYISEYLNKKQQLRYNVRFGYFENKRTALKGLKHYTENMDGKGYLVKLKRTMHAENNRSSSSVPTNKTAKF